MRQWWLPDLLMVVGRRNDWWNQEGSCFWLILVQILVRMPALKLKSIYWMKNKISGLKCILWVIEFSLLLMTVASLFHRKILVISTVEETAFTMYMEQPFMMMKTVMMTTVCVVVVALMVMTIVVLLLVVMMILSTLSGIMIPRLMTLVAIQVVAVLAMMITKLMLLVANQVVLERNKQQIDTKEYLMKTPVCLPSKMVSLDHCYHPLIMQKFYGHRHLGLNPPSPNVYKITESLLSMKNKDEAASEIKS